MGNTASTEEKIYKIAKNGDHLELAGVFNQIRRQGREPKQFLEYQDLSGQTPLIIASYRGFYTCVELLLNNGANVHHVTKAQDRNTALYEAVNRGHIQIAELLMRFGGNPFLENGRGLTSVDAAINKQNTQMLRVLESRSDFSATLLLKIPRFMGLGAEWKERWIVVMPRYQLTTGRGTVARSLMVCYKDMESCVPSCKVWLDGAIARQVVGSAGAQVLQCGLSLHKNHALAANVHLTGDPIIGYTMHLRPKDSAPRSVEALRKLMDLVNGSRSQPSQPPHQRNASQASTSSQQTPYHTPPQTPNLQGHQQISSDAELARRLQEQYNDEWTQYKCPPVSTGDRVSQPYSSGNPEQAPIASGYPNIGAAQNGVTQPGHQHHQSTASSSSFQSVPSAPLYPQINMQDAQTFQPPAGASSQAEEGFGASPDWYRSNAVQANHPPASATQPQPGISAEGPSKQSSMNSGPPLDDDDAGQCVICLDAPATAGFLHGESVHKCCCRGCALELKKAKLASCPLCKQHIDHIILNFY